MNNLNPSSILKEARSKAGRHCPTVETLNHLAHAAGFEIETDLIIRPVENSHMLEDLCRILQLTPEERLEEVKAANKFLSDARHV